MPSYAGVSANVASLILPPSVAGGSFAELFTLLGNPPGVAYDFTAPGGLTQDRGGLDVVTAAAQSIGLAHDYARASSGWVSGTELVSNGGFDTDTSGWVIRAATGGTISWNAGVLRFEPPGAGLSTAATQLCSSFVVGRTYQIYARGRRVSGTGQASFEIRTADGGGGSSLAQQFTTSATFVPLSQSWVATQTSAQISLRSTANDTIAEWDNISVREITGNPLLAPTDARRPTWGAMANGLPCSVWDGTRAMATAAAVDYSSTDQITVMAAVRKTSDATQGVILEAGATTEVANSGFSLIGPHSGANATYRARSSGSVLTSCTSSGLFAAPDSAILVVRSRISTDYIELIRNGTQIATSASDQGTGNYGNHILNIGARNAASPSLFFNGEITRIAAIGGALTTEQLTYAVSLISRGFAPSP